MRLRQLRKEKGLSMKELGKIIGVSESTISLYETGKHEPSHIVLLKIADYFGVSTDYLLGRIDEDIGEVVPSIVDVIKKECKIHGISIHSLEQELQIGGGTIGKWKNASPKADTVIKIADYFGVSVDYLLGRETEQPQEKEKPIPEDELDRQIIEGFMKLSESEQQKVSAFIAGLIAARK